MSRHGYIYSLFSLCTYGSWSLRSSMSLSILLLHCHFFFIRCTDRVDDIKNISGKDDTVWEQWVGRWWLSYMIFSQYQHVPSVVFSGRLTSRGLGSLNILTPVCSKYWGFDLCSSFSVPPLILWLSVPAAGVRAAGWALLTETTFGVCLHLDSSVGILISSVVSSA